MSDIVAPYLLSSTSSTIPLHILYVYTNNKYAYQKGRFVQENLENTLASLVAIPSVPNDSFACHAVMNFVHDELKAYDLSIQTHFDIQNPWLIATTKHTRSPDILFYAHLDVVAGASQLFQMQKVDGHLLGRGVFDMKFAAACYLEFLRNHADALSDFNIGFLFTTDEEKDSGCMDDVISAGFRPKVVFMPDGGDNWSIEKRAKGFYSVELISLGKTAHGSRPWEGDSALHNLLDTIKPLRDKYTLQEKDHPTLMINSIQSGHAINQIPDHAIAKLDFRCFNQHEMDEYVGLLKSIVKTRSNLSFIVHNFSETMEFNDASPYVQSFIRSYKKVRGISPTFCDSYGATDSRFFTPIGIPCVIVEPRGGGRHSDDEWLMAADLAVYYQLIEHWILQETAETHFSSHRERAHV